MKLIILAVCIILSYSAFIFSPDVEQYNWVTNPFTGLALYRTDRSVVANRSDSSLFFSSDFVFDMDYNYFYNLSTTCKNLYANNCENLKR